MIGDLIKIALRNLARHKVKTFLSVLAITVSVSAYIAMDGWIEGMTIDSLRNLISYETGAAKLQTKTYFEKLDERPMYENFGGWETYASALEEAGYAAAPRFVFGGTLYSDTGSAPVEFHGIDPERDGEVMRLAESVEFGRFIGGGEEFAILLGSMTADKLKTGIPTRPTRFELENEILPLLPEAEHNFVRGLYVRSEKKAGAWDPKEQELAEGDERCLIRRDIRAAEADRFWAMLEAAGRMNLQIATVIDIKAAPETVRKDKYEADLLPAFTAEERALFERAYAYDEFLEAWLLEAEDPALPAEVLAAMVRVDYGGAIRHVNQLIPVVLAGMVNSVNPQLNYNTAFIPLDALQGDTGMMLDGEVTELIIRRKDADHSVLPGKAESALAITAAIEAGAGPLPPELAVEGWRGYGKDAIAAAAGDNWSTRILIIILFILSFLGIANTMLLAILERTREIGMIRAQGMTDGQLVFTLMLEAGLAGLIGSALGVIAGCLITIPMIDPGVDFGGMADALGGDFGYRIAAVFRAAWNPPVIVLSGIGATIVSALVAFFPARRALTMSIADSMRFD